MKISANKIDHFIKQPDKNIIAVLIYGPDIGLVSQRANNLANWAVKDINDPFNVAEINCDALKNTPSIVSDEMAAMSLTNERRLILFKNAGNSDAKAIELGITNQTSQDQAFLIVTAGDLKPGALRKMFENSTSCAALPCYVDEIYDLTPIVINQLRSKGLSFDPDVVPYIAINCRGDRMIVISEIEKLELFLGEKKHISLADVKTSIGETTESNFDDICNSIAMGNHYLVDNHLSKALLQGTMPVAIIRSTQRFFNRIQFAQGLVNEGQTQDQALKQLRPPVFFKQAPLFKQFLSKWNGTKSKRLWKILEELYMAELECKKSNSNPQLMCNRYLMKITSLCK